MRSEFNAHSEKQFNLIKSKSRLTIAGTGVQWGKSIAGSYWMLMQLAEFTDKEDTFLLMAPNYKIMSQSMLPYFVRLMNGFGLGEYHKADAAYVLWDGRTVYCRTATDPDSIVGIPRVRAYWLDEAGKVPLYFHENILGRAATVGARGLYTTSPYSRNWLFKDYIKPKEKGELPDVTLIRAASWENKYHTLYHLEERQKMQAAMDPRRFEMLFGGEWGKQTGLVYDCFDEELNTCDEQRLPPGTIYYAGIDWGHTEPFVITVRGITPDNQHYQVSEFYKTGMTVPEQAAVARQKMVTYNIRHFYCGADRPENILLFNQKGIPAVAVPEKDIQVGTDLHYELIKTRAYKIFRGTSPHTIDELETYHYPEPKDLDPDKNEKIGTPVGQNDHCVQLGSPIETIDGPKPIERIQAGNLVLTRKGYKPVLKVWDNGERETLELKFSSGKKLCCTDDHRIYTKNRGFVCANALSFEDACVIPSAWLKWSSLMELSLGDIPRALGQICATISEPLRVGTRRAFDTFIVRFGKLLMGLSLEPITSTTKTEIHSITTSQTLSSFPRRCTEASISKSDGQMTQFLETTSESGLKHFGSLDLRGERLPQALHSQRRTAETFAERIEDKLQRFASIASKPIRLTYSLLKSLSSVLRRAAIEPPRVVGVRSLGVQRVFDLTVQDCHEYFASGLLVHNCVQANRYITLRTYQSHLKRRPFTPEEADGSGGRRETQEQRLKRLTKPLEKTRIVI